MVDTIKFSEMTAGGDLPLNSKTPGLLSGGNVLFNNPWTFLPSGDTAARPTPSSAINYRLRFNTELQLYEYYDAVLGSWVQLQENAFTAGPFVTFTASSFLPDAQNIGLLADGILRQTITTGVSTIDIAVNGIDFYGPGFTGYLQSPIGIKDNLGNIVVKFTTSSSPDVYVDIQNNVVGNGGVVTVGGVATDIGLLLIGKGTGGIGFRSENLTVPINFYTGTNHQHTTNFNFADTATVRTATFQDSDGTVAWLTDIPAGSPSALTRTNDTNVTVTLGGTPSTALLQAVSLTLGWAGTLAPSRGGLGTGTAPSAGQIPIGTSSGVYTPAAISSGTNILVGNGDGSISIGITGIISGTNGGTGVNNGASTITLGGSLITSGAFASTFTMTGITTVTFPTSGTLATTSQLVTPAALTKTDDTNVTLTLGGSPGTALVNAASITVGWTGQLGLTRGGTAASLTASNGGIVYSNASTLAILAGTATAGQMLQSGSSTTPAWSTTTYPATNAINTIMYASSANILGVITPVNSAVLISSAGGVPSWSTTLPSGIAATDMNLTTPTLGVASATSINFGGGALSSYIPSTSWTPTMTFATPGDLSVAYTTQTGAYIRIGGIVYFTFNLTFTPTYTTAASTFLIQGLPVASGQVGWASFIHQNNVTYPAGTTYLTLNCQSGTTQMRVWAAGTLNSGQYLTTTSFATTVIVNVQGQGFYFV